jgi:O-antigen/teichoic acid export membrane protein
MSVLGSGIAGLISAMGQLGAAVAANLERRLEQFRIEVRLEVHRAAATLALSIAAVALGFAALAFGAVAILIASWDSDPVLAAALIALGFCLLSIIAVLLMRSGTR